MTRIKMASPAVQAAIFATLSRDRAVTAAVRARAQEIRDEARSRAGEGAEHIIVARHYDRQSRQVTYRVGWRREHFYMAFKELGTVHQPARPFMRPAADMYGGREPRGGI